jgi:tetratricopeptide (TPR) repeat protein
MKVLDLLRSWITKSAKFLVSDMLGLELDSDASVPLEKLDDMVKTANILFFQCKFAEAKVLNERAMRGYMKLNNIDVFTCALNLVETERVLGNFKKAHDMILINIENVQLHLTRIERVAEEATLEEKKRFRERIWKDKKERRSFDMIFKSKMLLLEFKESLSHCLQGLEKPLEAISLAEKTLAEAVSLLGPEDETVCNIQHSIGSIYFNISNYDRAKTYIERSLEISNKLFGHEHSKSIQNIHVLGRILFEGGNKDDRQVAMKLLDTSVKSAEKLYGSGHTMIVSYRRYLASCTHKLQKQEDADETADTEISILNAKKDQTMLLIREGKKKEAEFSQREILRLAEIEFGSLSHITLTEMHNLAYLLYKDGDVAFETTTTFGIVKNTKLNEEARTLFQRCLDGQIKILGWSNDDTLRTAANFALMYMKNDLYLEARSIMEQARQSICDLYGDGDGFNSEFFINILDNLTILYRMMEDFSKFEDVERQCIKCCHKKFGPTHIRTGRNQVSLAHYLASSGNRLEDALKYVEEGSKVLESHLGSMHPETIHAVSILNFILERI